jgi:hypothetical protein
MNLRTRRNQQGQSEMTSTNAPPQPVSPAPIEQLDPIGIARLLAQQFSVLAVDVTTFGFRDRLYTFLKGAFLLGAFFKEHPEDYRRFANDDYWRDVRQKPNKRNVMRSVLAYTMRTKRREALQNRAYKLARVLEDFYRNEVESDDIPQLLRVGGGIDANYAALCRDAQRRGRRGEGLPVVRLSLVPTEVQTTDDDIPDTPAVAVQGRLAVDQIHRDANRSNDDGQRTSASPLRAASDATDKLRGEVQPEGAPPRGRRHGTPRRVTLQVEMFDFELEGVLHAKRAIDLREC